MLTPATRYSRLPIFPLPNVQLFPHALLPLHVFEPRYRDLVRDAKAGDGLIGMATFEPGFEKDYQGRPTVRPVVGVGRIVGHETLTDGRSNLLLRGIARARIEREWPPNERYRIVDAVELASYLPVSYDTEAAKDTLTLLADQLALKLPSGGSTLRELVRSQAELAALVDVLAAALVTDAKERQALLETLDVAARSERVSREIATVLARLSDSEGSPN
jgi:Lon protease-like protein